MTARGVQTIANSPQLANLVELEISGHDFGSAGAAALVASPYLTKLQKLNLYCVELPDADKQSLRQKFGEEVVSI
jgi:hypothetical protein